MGIDFGKHLEEGKTYQLDVTFRGGSKVVLISKNKIFGRVCTVEGSAPWEVMLNRLTKIKGEIY